MSKVTRPIKRLVENATLFGNSLAYSRNIARKGRKLGQLGGNLKLRLEDIESTFADRKSELTIWAHNKLASAKSQLVGLEEQYEYLCQTIETKKAALKIDQVSIPEYSLTQGLILLFATLIFLVAEFDLTIQTISSSLGLNIDIELIIEEPYNIENYGGFLLAAALGALCLILGLWLGPYIVQPYFRKEQRSLRLFKWLVLPVGILVFGLSLANAILRWRFSESLFDPSVETWRSLWTPDGAQSTFGLLFIIFLILSLQLCGALGLAFGHHHLRLFKRDSKYLLLRLNGRIKGFIFRPSLKKLVLEKCDLLTQKHELRNFIAEFDNYLERWLTKLNTRRDKMIKRLLTKYQEGKEEAEYQANQEKMRRPLHQHIRRQLITDITGEAFIQNYN